MKPSRIDFIMMAEILPPSIRQEVRQNDTHYIIKCPHCLETLGYQKEKLYIDKSLRYGWCFRQNHVYIDKKANIVNPDIFIKNLNLFPKSYSLNYLDQFPMEVYQKASEDITPEGLDYLLNSRKNRFLVERYKEYSLRFVDDGILIPFFFNSTEPKYYQKRLYNPRGGMKYYLPPIKAKPFYMINRMSSVWVLCEGVFDAIAISMMNEDVNVISLQGSTMTNFQLGVFRSYVPENIILWLDDLDLTYKLKGLLHRNLPYSDIRVIDSFGLDPEELMLDYYENKDRSIEEDSNIIL